MDLTERSEEDACLALYECDNDVERAAIYLLENLEIGALITTTKKKKNKAAADGESEEFDFPNNNNRESGRDNANERSKGGRVSNRGGPAGRGRSRAPGDSSRSMGDDGNRGPRGSGARRGGFSSRGRGGGRMGPRGRDQNHRNNYRNQDPNEHQEIDNWDPASTQLTENNKNEETWGDCGDWDNEEYTGSLSDTKVFTPSTQQDLVAPPGLEQQILQPPPNDVSQYNSTGANVGQYGDIHSSSTAAQQLRQAIELPLGQGSASLSAEQSQYFNTLGTQNNNSGYQSSVQYQYNDQVVSGQQAPRSQQQVQQQQQQQQQQRSRARVPPPSKIPSSAVEMPSDVDLPVYLDVQFGGLDFGTGTEESYETEKYTQGMDQTTGDDYTNKKSSTVVTKNSQSTGLAGIQPPQLIQNADSISSSTQADLSSNYAQRNASSIGTGGQSTLDQLGKPTDIYASGAASGNAYQNLSYQSSQKSGYQTGGYGTNNYGASQTSNSYPSATSNTYGGYNQNSYQQQSQGTQSNSTGQQQTGTAGSGVSNSTSTQSSTTGYVCYLGL
jgi:Ubiquitin-associated protein 2